MSVYKLCKKNTHTHRHMILAPVDNLRKSFRRQDSVGQEYQCRGMSCRTESSAYSSLSHEIILAFSESMINIISSRGKPGRVAQSVWYLTRKSGVPGSIPCLATYFRFSFRFFKKGSCQLLAKVCARSTG